MPLSAVLLSNSTNGRQIKVVAVATAGTLIHTASAVVGVFDEVWLYAVNTSTVSVLLTIEFGGVLAPDDSITVSVPPSIGPVNVVAGIRVNGGVAIRAFAATANVVQIHGNVNRFTP